MTCQGGFAIPLIATKGAIEGTLSVVPEPDSGLKGFQVWARQVAGGGFFGSSPTDENGHFEFRDKTEPARSNNWGLFVSEFGKPPPTPTSPVSVTYRLGVGSEAQTTVEVTSSQLSSAASR
jgi:hypothetical protein